MEHPVSELVLYADFLPLGQRRLNDSAFQPNLGERCLDDDDMGKALLEGVPPSGDSVRLLARQLGRLIEDFVECDEAGRFEITALAQELAEERLRKTERTTKKPCPPS